MHVHGQFRFISKEPGEAATTAAQIGSRARWVPAVPRTPCLRSAASSIDPVLRSSVLSRGAPAYTAAALLTYASGPSAQLYPAVPSVPPRAATAAVAARTARAASVREAPVVIRSSTSTTGPSASSPAPAGATASAPVRLSSRCRELSPAWSATALRCRSTATTRAGTPLRRSSPAAASAIRRAGSCPRARTALRAEGTGTSSTGRLSRAWSPLSPARTAPAKAVPNGAASASAPRSLWASSTERTSSAYREAACTVGSPGGSGTGRTTRGAAPLSAVRHSGQSAVRGRPQPPHSVGSTRSVRSCHHPRMSTTVPTPAHRGHPCGQRPVDNSARRPDGSTTATDVGPQYAAATSGHAEGEDRTAPQPHPG